MKPIRCMLGMHQWKVVDTWPLSNGIGYSEWACSHCGRSRIADALDGRSE